MPIKKKTVKRKKVVKKQTVDLDMEITSCIGTMVILSERIKYYGGFSVKHHELSGLLLHQAKEINRRRLVIKNKKGLK